MLEKFFDRYPYMIWVFTIGLFVICSILESLI